jgi:hypothetical protein
MDLFYILELIAAALVLRAIAVGVLVYIHSSTSTSGYDDATRTFREFVKGRMKESKTVRRRRKVRESGPPARKTREERAIEFMEQAVLDNAGVVGFAPCALESRTIKRDDVTEYQVLGK